MIVDAAVSNERGQLLAAKGTELDERRIKLLLSWGVVEVSVQGAGGATLEEIDERLAVSHDLRRLSAEIDARFSGAEGHPFLRELRRVVKQIALEEHEREAGGGG